MMSTAAAPWSLSAYASAAVPHTKLAIITAGITTGFPSTAGTTWISRDGVGAQWSNVTSANIRTVVHFTAVCIARCAV